MVLYDILDVAGVYRERHEKNTVDSSSSGRWCTLPFLMIHHAILCSSNGSGDWGLNWVRERVCMWLMRWYSGRCTSIFCFLRASPMIEGKTEKETPENGAFSREAIPLDVRGDRRIGIVLLRTKVRRVAFPILCSWTRQTQTTQHNTCYYSTS